MASGLTAAQGSPCRGSAGGAQMGWGAAGGSGQEPAAGFISWVEGFRNWGKQPCDFRMLGNRIWALRSAGCLGFIRNGEQSPFVPTTRIYSF